MFTVHAKQLLQRRQRHLANVADRLDSNFLKTLIRSLANPPDFGNRQRVEKLVDTVGGEAHTLGELVGIWFQFGGLGSIDTIQLSNAQGQMIYEENF